MMKLVYHTGLLIRLSEFESQCPYHSYHIEAHCDVVLDSTHKESSVLQYGDIVQLEERRLHTATVGGSNPSFTTKQ